MPTVKILLRGSSPVRLRSLSDEAADEVFADLRRLLAVESKPGVFERAGPLDLVSVEVREIIGVERDDSAPPLGTE